MFDIPVHNFLKTIPPLLCKPQLQKNLCFQDITLQLDGKWGLSNSKYQM